jgi:ABC-type antimicrobial peptide transport system permease subunit
VTGCSGIRTLPRLAQEDPKAGVKKQNRSNGEHLSKLINTNININKDNKLFVAGKDYNILGYSSGRTLLPFDDDNKIYPVQLYVKFNKDNDYENSKNKLQEYIFDEFSRNITLVSNRSLKNSSIIGVLKTLLGALFISLITVFYAMLYIINIVGIKTERDRRDYAIKIACGAKRSDLRTQGFIQQTVYCTAASATALIFIISGLIFLNSIKVISGIKYLMDPLVIAFVILTVVLLCFMISFINSKVILKKAAGSRINEILR